MIRFRFLLKLLFIGSQDLIVNYSRLNVTSEFLRNELYSRYLLPRDLLTSRGNSHCHLKKKNIFYQIYHNLIIIHKVIFRFN